MQIEQKIRSEWDRLYVHGDIAAISEQSGIGRITISEAINSGEMTMRVFEAIQKFYNKRKEEIKELKS